MDLSVVIESTRKRNLLEKKGIHTAEDLAHFLPRAYLDCTKETGVLPETEISCLVVQVNDIRCTANIKVSTMLADCTIVQTGEPLTIFWFNQNYYYDKLRIFIGSKVFVAGKVKYDYNHNKHIISVPMIFDAVSKGRGIHPIYSKINGVAEEGLRADIKHIFDFPTITKETLPYELVSSLKMLSIQDALYRLHFPISFEQIEKARERLVFDELLYFAIQNERISRESPVGSPFQIKTYNLMRTIRENLPFTLTPSQDQAITEMVARAKEGKRINTLIQGDVGSGKTIIAFLMMAAFVDSGYQAALMAPTQVLAKQHYDNLKNLVEQHGFSVVYLSTEQKKADQTKALKAIADGSAQFIIGTSAVIGKNVEYRNLALTVVDEEHRFGVAQREALSEKAAMGAHNIRMSATPIPRTMAQTMYGNTLQFISIKKPSSRKEIRTGIQPDRRRIYNFVLSQIKHHHHQIYVVCPMIDTNEDREEVKSVEAVSKEYREALEPYGVRIATLTGRDKKGKMEETIEAFRKGEVDILIATTVIEVGVDVPNATGIIITNAEQFGLATLHQLRGRVGRSNLESFCVLETKEATEQGWQRLNVFCNETDGEKISQADFKIRGAGDILGTQQSGENKYLSLMLKFQDEYKRAQEIAKMMLDNGTKCGLMDRVEKDLQEQSDKPR